MNVVNWIRNLFYLCLGFIIIIGFSQYFENIFLEHFVNNRLNYVHSSFLLDVLVILGLFLYTSIQVNNCAFSIPKNTITYFFLLITPLYLYERFFNDFFEFTKFRIADGLAYFDVVLPIVILHFGKFLKFLVSKEENIITHKNPILDDSPISKDKDDQLEGLLKISANKIKKIVLENKFATSFTIGLNGEWGDGKSSVFNLLKNQLKDEDLIVFDFNPWMGYDKKVLVKDFFNSLSEAIGQDFSDEINSYSEELLDNGDGLTFFRLIRNVFFRKQSLDTIFNSINKKIGIINKKIVIFIDDVDRLDKEEIFELLKLIRKTANFQNTFFIMAYDRNYVNDSIKNDSGETAIRFLDKIVNVELSMPYFDKYILKNYFIRLLKKEVPEKLHYKVDFFQDRYQKDPLAFDLGFSENDLFIYWLKNFREIKKVINSISINFQNLYGEINFYDLVHLEILKLKHPFLYNIIYTRQHEIFSINRTHYCYCLAPLDKVKAANLQFKKFLEDRRDNFGEQKVDKEVITTVFDAYLDEYVDKNNINLIEKTKILDLIYRLFPKENKDGNLFLDFSSKTDEENKLAVKFVNKFERYFSNVIFEKHISEDEVERLLSLDFQSLAKQISIWNSEGKLLDLGKTLNKKWNFNNQKEYENTLNAIFLCLNFENNTIEFQQLVSKMFGISLFPKIFENVDSAKQFFQKLFSSIDPPFNVFANLLNELRKRNMRRGGSDSEIFPLSNNEIDLLLENYLLTTVKDGIFFSNEFWSLYFTCQSINDNGEKVPFTKANDIILFNLQDEKNIIPFLKSLVIFDNYGYESNFRKGAIEDVFGGADNFEKQFLNNLDENIPFIKQFKDYYLESKKSNWNLFEYDYEFLKQILD